MLALAVKGPLWGDLEDQLGVDRNSKSKNEDGYTMGSCLLRRVAVGVQPASTRGALQLVLETLLKLGSAVDSLMYRRSSSACYR